MRGLLAVLLAVFTAVSGRPGSAEQRPLPMPPIPITAVFSQDFPDPSVIRFGDAWFAYGTATGWEPRGHVFPILETRDLAHWVPAGDVFSAPPAWAAGHFWGPSVIAYRGNYYLYYSALSVGDEHCVAVATAPGPAGPFTDRGPIACDDGATARGFIDPAPFVDGGHAYLYFSVDGPLHHSISAFELTPDLLHEATPRVELFGVTETWEMTPGNATVEGPSVFKAGRTYVLLYSGGDWRAEYSMGYATAPTPLGPFMKAPAPLLTTDASVTGPGGGSYFEDAKGKPWLAYHAWDAGARDLHLRPLRIKNGVVTLG